MTPHEAMEWVVVGLMAVPLIGAAGILACCIRHLWKD